MREYCEAEKVNSSKIKADLELAQNHTEGLQQENLALQEDIERLQKIAHGLEELNKQFTDLEDRQEHEKSKLMAQRDAEIEDIVAEKDAEINNVAKIIGEKQLEIQKLALLIEELSGELKKKDDEMQTNKTELEQLRKANAAQLADWSAANADHIKTS